MHETTERVVQDYLRRRCRAAGGSDRLFVSLRGKPLRYETVRCTFNEILRRLGLRDGTGQRQPRLHDLRHSCAVRALESCPRDQVATHVLALSTYLGHARVADTYWYLHVTPQLLATIADDCRSFLYGGAP
jgi:integrase